MDDVAATFLAVRGLSTQLGPRSAEQCLDLRRQCPKRRHPCASAISLLIEQKVAAAVTPAATSLNRRLRHRDSQNLSNAIWWWSKADVGNVKRAIGAEGHSRREEES